MRSCKIIQSYYTPLQKFGDMIKSAIHGTSDGFRQHSSNASTLDVVKHYETKYGTSGEL